MAQLKEGREREQKRREKWGREGGESELVSLPGCHNWALSCIGGPIRVVV